MYGAESVFFRQIEFCSLETAKSGKKYLVFAWTGPMPGKLNVMDDLLARMVEDGDIEVGAKIDLVVDIVAEGWDLKTKNPRIAKEGDAPAPKRRKPVGKPPAE